MRGRDVDYLRVFVTTMLSHRLGWWVSLALTYVIQGSLFTDDVQRFLSAKFDIAVPSHPSVAWLFLPLLLWIVASFAHRGTLQILKSCELVFEDPFVVRDVPLYGPHAVQIATNDLISVIVRNRPYDMSVGRQVEQAHCSVQIFHKEGSKLLEFEYPRWTENQKPGYQGSPPDRFPTEWNFRNLVANDSRNRIDFAIKPHGQDSAFGFKGSSQRIERWCDENLTIPLGDYNCRLVVKGVGLRKPAEIWMRLRNVVGGERITIDRIEKPKWAKPEN